MWLDMIDKKIYMHRLKRMFCFTVTPVMIYSYYDFKVLTQYDIW